MKIFRHVLPLLGLLGLLSGCSLKEYRLFQSDNDDDASVTSVSDEEYKDEMLFENKINPRDRLSIQVYNQSNVASQEMTSMLSSRGSSTTMAGQDESLGLLVTKRGMVRLPLIGEMRLAGMTEDEASEHLIKEYKKYLRNPYVTVEIMNQRLYVLGEVRSPGIVQITNGTMNIVEAIARSGDLTDYAQRSRIKILRGDLRHPEVRIVDLTQMASIEMTSLFLKPNDIVYVQPRTMKGYNMTFEEISPPFKLISTLLQPFVSILYLERALKDR